MMAHWFKPSIPHRSITPPPINTDKPILAPAKAFWQHKELHQLKLISNQDELIYLGIEPNQSQHFYNAHTGKRLPEFHLEYAEALAQYFLDDSSSPLLAIERIDSFEPTYGYINRFLPVYRVRLDRPDRLEVLVDLRTASLASYDDSFRRFALLCFDLFHRWSFLGDRNSWVRISAILLVSILSLAAAITGLIKLISQKKSVRAREAKKWHRSLGWLSLPLYFMFTLSGIYHVSAKYTPDDSPLWSSSQAIAVDQLTQPISTNPGPILALSLAQIQGESFYRIIRQNDHRTPSFESTYSNSPSKIQDQTYAIELACEFSGYLPEAVKRVELIESFRKDYGFIFKRLPVWRVHFDQQEYWHYTVDTEDSHMAMRLKPASLIESLSFIYLHKLHFLDPISPTLRHYMSAISVSLLCSLILSGLLLSRKRSSQ